MFVGLGLSLPHNLSYRLDELGTCVLARQQGAADLWKQEFSTPATRLGSLTQRLALQKRNEQAA